MRSTSPRPHPGAGRLGYTDPTRTRPEPLTNDSIGGLRLIGAYVFGDLTGRLMALGAGYEMATLSAVADGPLTAVTLGPDGEFYLLTHSNGVFRLAPG